MKKVLFMSVLAVAVGFGVSSATGAPTTQAAPAAKTFPKGIWHGTGTSGKRNARIGSIDVTYATGSLVFTYFAQGKPSGTADFVIPRATGVVNEPGFSGIAHFRVTADLDLSPQGSQIVAKGKAKFDGVVVANGAEIPTKFTERIAPMPLTILSATCKKAVGRLGPPKLGFSWVAYPRRKPASCR